MSHKKDVCPYCGNNPVNHTLNKLSESIDITLAPLYQAMSKLAHTPIDRAMNFILKMSVQPLQYIGVWSYHTDSSKARSERSKVIWEEAQKRGIDMQGIAVLGKPIEQHRAKIGNKWYHFESLPIPPHFNQNSFAWIDDKWKLRKLFKENNIPMAHGGYARTFADAREIFKSGTAPFIVKPRVGSRGRHTTTHIYTIKELKHAFQIAKQLCHYVIVEEQLVGSVYRGTYVNGEVVGVLRGDPPRVTGNGKHTIQELVQIKNKKKHTEVADVLIDERLQTFLHRQKLSLSTILQKGKTIDLSEKIGTSYGGFRAEELPISHPQVVTTIKRAGDIIGCAVVGFDFIIKDVTKDPTRQRWGIIEANSLPLIDLHHFPLQGKSINVAAKIWDLWNTPKKTKS